MAVLGKAAIEAAGEPTEQERAALAAVAEFRATGTGYSKQQSTRPQTVGYGLVDSPAAQCAWIVEKFWAWADCLYWESYGARPEEPIDVPAGFSVFPKEIFPVSRRWLEHRLRDLRHYNVLPAATSRRSSSPRCSRTSCGRSSATSAEDQASAARSPARSDAPKTTRFCVAT